MSFADDVINGNYTYGSYKKKKIKEESFAERVINGNYEYGSYKKKKLEEDENLKTENKSMFGNKIVKIGKDLEDGYQFGDISKAFLGTANDLIANTTKGLLSPLENGLDVATNLLATGISQGSGALGIKNEEVADKMRKFADKDFTANAARIIANVNPIGATYNVINGTPNKIFNPAEVNLDEDKNILENYGEGLKKAWINDQKEQEYEKSSVAGEYVDKIAELIGHTMGLKIGRRNARERNNYNRNKKNWNVFKQK